MPTAHVERLLAIELNLETISDRMHRDARERDSLRRERSSILLSIGWEDRRDYEQAKGDLVGRALDQISAVRARP